MGSVVTSPSFEKVFNLDSTMIGTVTAMFEVGCIIGAWTTSLWGEHFGRKRIVHTGSFCVCVGAAIQASSYKTAQLIVGRIVAGIGMGFITSSVPVWQAETSPAGIRGAMVCCSLSFVLLGQVSSPLAKLIDKISHELTLPSAHCLLERVGDKQIQQ